MPKTFVFVIAVSITAFWGWVATVPVSAAPATQAGPMSPAAPSTDGYPAARLQIETMRAAADDLAIALPVKQKLLARLDTARAQASAAAARHAAAESYDSLLAALNADINALLKDESPAFMTHVTQVKDEVRAFGQQDTGGLRRMIDLLLTLTSEQRRKVDGAIAEASQKLDALAALPAGQRELPRQDIGLATRAAIRAALTPAQLADWDMLTAPAPRAPARAATHPAIKLTEVEAEFYPRFEVMRLAAAEGPYTENQKTRLNAQINQAQADIAAAIKAPIKRGSVPTYTKIEAIRTDLKQSLQTILREDALDFDRRRDQIQREVDALRLAHHPLDWHWLGDVDLTAQQKGQINQILLQYAHKLKSLQEQSGVAPSPDAQVQQDQLAFATRAAIRLLLTPQQIKRLDPPALPKR